MDGEGKVKYFELLKNINFKMMLKWGSYLIIHTSWIIHKQSKVTFFLFLYCTKKIFSLHTNFGEELRQNVLSNFWKNVAP